MNIHFKKLHNRIEDERGVKRVLSSHQPLPLGGLRVEWPMRLPRGRAAGEMEAAIFVLWFGV